FTVLASPLKPDKLSTITGYRLPAQAGLSSKDAQLQHKHLRRTRETTRTLIVVLFAALRTQRKKEPLIISKEDVRDNVVSYNDEGGGEEDTQAFDIGTLRILEAIEERRQWRDIVPETFYRPVRQPVLPPTRDNNGDVRDFINQRLQDNDSDPTAPPYDSLATYAYEGNGSVAESLSSLESVTTEGDQDYNDLSEWGPRFKKLVDMYGGDDSDRDS
uniref:Cadherin Y-type LIR-motif domain-containing protein n=2 Tax=Amphiprion ocellaris TaxID=80972 RepID=A0AAQ5ZG23_AMPOC